MSKLYYPTDEEERNILQGIALDKDSAEWTEDMYKVAKRTRGQQKSPTKVAMTMRIDADVSAWLKSQDGYSAIVNNALREYMTETRT